jgi:multisubunit Na+/H+ antiporter MnhG subunit
MNAGHIAVIVLLAVAAITTAACCLALLVMDDVFDRMHYLAPVTAIAMPALLAAVVIQEGWGQATLKTVLVLFALLLVNAVLTHATARAARVRQSGDWLPDPKENIPGYAEAPRARKGRR